MDFDLPESGFKPGRVLERRFQAIYDAFKLVGINLGDMAKSSAFIPKFVSPDTMTVQKLLTDYPAVAAVRGMYARVNNFGGYVDRVLRCDYDSSLNYHYWVPTQPEYGRSMALIADMSLKRLLSPSSIVLTGSILTGVVRNVTIDTANGRPGEIIEIKNTLTSLLGGLNILGTGLGSAVALPLGGYQKYMIDGAGGALKVVRLV